MQALIRRLEEGYDFQCTGGSLKNCKDWQELVRTINVSGLEKALEIIRKEKEYAVQVNPHMALGMSQIEMLIQNELSDILLPNKIAR